MSYYDEEGDHQMEVWLDQYLENELERLSKEAAFNFLAHNGDAIEARVRQCLADANALRDIGFAAASLVSAVVGIEVTIRFFLLQPLLQGAFLSREWAALLTQRIIRPRSAEDRDLLPAILRNWGVDITRFTLPSGEQLWESIVVQVWPARNRYIHQADTVAMVETKVAVECLQTLLHHVVTRVAHELGFTRDKTNKWSVVATDSSVSPADLNPPRQFVEESPF